MPEEIRANAQNVQNEGEAGGAAEKAGTEVSANLGIESQEVTPRDALRCVYNFPVEIFTREQMIFMGRENVLYFKTEWEKILVMSKQIQDRQVEMLEILGSGSVDDVWKTAERYDNPRYAVRPSKYEGETYAPDDPEAGEREVGTTTLNICGWCEYAIPYMVPYSTSTIPDSKRVYRPSCGFLNDVWDNVYAGGEFNTPCMLTHPSKEGSSLEEILKGIQERYEAQAKYSQMVQQRIDYLEEAIAEAESKPLFPRFRKLKHYEEGTPVYFMGDRHGVRSTLPYPFSGLLDSPTCRVQRGTVVGYCDFTDSVLVSRPWEPEKEPLRIECTDRRLVSFGDLTYLIDNPDFAQLWLASEDCHGWAIPNALDFYRQNRYFG